MIRISYLVTLYNKSAFLPYVLAGLQAQQGEFEREFIFVDDGSTDDTLVELRRQTAGWTDPVIIITQANAGPAFAFNAGLARATGAWLKPVDGDDVLMPWATAALLDGVSRHGADLAVGLNAKMGYLPGAELTPEALLARNPDPGGDPVVLAKPFERSLRRAHSNPSCWMARTDLVRSTGGCDVQVFTQDYSLELRLTFRARAVAYTPRPLFVAPEAAAGRLSDNEAQILHDLNMAMAGFLETTPGLSVAQTMKAYRRCFGRAWSWARRHNGQKPLSREHRRYLLALLPWNGLSPQKLRESTAAFRAHFPVRLPKAPPPAG